MIQLRTSSILKLFKTLSLLLLTTIAQADAPWDWCGVTSLNNECIVGGSEGALSCAADPDCLDKAGNQSAEVHCSDNFFTLGSCWTYTDSAHNPELMSQARRGHWDWCATSFTLFSVNMMESVKGNRIVWHEIMGIGEKLDVELYSGHEVAGPISRLNTLKRKA
ncbi:hypothetical protein AJ78_08747 [Emergomyces pasteurianus Ep9510]|uniref:Uncharacterized protein n=1 Tax=Emergomyces pasteurianus Ep9510 TaxID=1447872 RepID=A0A1J9PQI7_9EURO|nr:hypothetical protein AJ78_08747 [Emergomyces pasteurianus Ep9510]